MRGAVRRAPRQRRREAAAQAVAQGLEVDDVARSGRWCWCSGARGWLHGGRHRDEDETFYVLDGTPTFRLGDDIVVAGPGYFVNVPKGVIHNFRNPSEEPLRMILTFTPAGIEKFFEETLDPAYDLTQDWPANLEEVGPRYAEAGPRYGTTLLPDA